jgi:hypothetical protein
MASLARLVALGRLGVTFTLTPQTVSSTTGALAAGTITGITSFSFIGQMKTCKRRQSNTREDVSPSSTRNRNMVITDSGTSYDITGFCYSNDLAATPTNVVDAVFNNADYVCLVASYKGNTETFYGVCGDFETGVESKGQIPWTFSLDPCDIGTQNPSFA